ncbi:MAG TPA: NPCBM/NEW2 domain-containing protein [Gemmataceae bacterium]|nr:NPCBM/NEW2 domain-containing protein [Gemmataceae bacterium]
MPLWFARAAEDGPRFTLHTADGPPRTGPLHKLGDNWLVRLSAEGGRAEGADVLSLRRADVPMPPFPDGEQLLFANGDRLPVSAEGLSLAGERLRFSSPDLNDGKPVQAPLAAVAALWFAAPDGREDEADRDRRRLATAKRTQDVVLLRNGDRVEGILTGLDRQAVEMEVARKPVKVPCDRVAAVALNTELAARLRPKGLYGRLTLDDGCRLSVSAAACADGQKVEAKALLGAAVRVPVGRVVSLDLLGGKAVYLSDLKPRKYEYASPDGSPFRYDLAADANALGGDLRLGGGTHARGLGMHSPCRVSYALPPGCRRFEALVGLDDLAGRDGGTGREGSARVRVLLDGKPQQLPGGGELPRRGARLALSVDVTGAKELTLEAAGGRSGSVLGCVDWADARLVK